MKTLTISYPEELPQTLKLSDEEFAAEVRFLAAAKLYELGKTSAGKAAEMAGIDKVTFLFTLGRYRVPAINLQAEEVANELKAVRSLS